MQMHVIIMFFALREMCTWSAWTRCTKSRRAKDSVKDEETSARLCYQLSCCRASLRQSPWLGANDLKYIINILCRDLRSCDQLTSPSLYAQKYAIIPTM